MESDNFLNLFAGFASIPRSERLKLLPPVKAPKNYKDPVKILEYEKAESARREVSLAHTPFLCQLARVYVMDVSGKPLFDGPLTTLESCRSFAAVLPQERNVATDKQLIIYCLDEETLHRLIQAVFVEFGLMGEYQDRQFLGKFCWGNSYDGLLSEEDKNVLPAGILCSSILQIGPKDFRDWLDAKVQAEAARQLAIRVGDIY